MVYLNEMEWCETPVVPPTMNTDVEQEIRRHLGMPMTILRYLAPVPWAAWSFVSKVQPVIHIPDKLSDLIELVVSMENSCRHCYGAIRSLLRLTGYSQQQITQLEEDLYHGDLSDAEKKMLTFARKCARSDPRPTLADLQELEAAGFSRLAIAEAAFVATSACYSNRVAIILGIPHDNVENIEQSWWGRLMRPVLSSRLHSLMYRAKQKNIQRYQPPPGGFPDSGIGARLIQALEGSPTAGVLYTILNEAWASAVLPRRSKALIFAIVAQSLDCPVCTTEACELLHGQGLLQDDIEQLLTYLYSDRLSPLELKLVDFARDSVRYQVSDLQDKAHQLRADLSQAELIELAALVGLANWVARLSIILQQC